MKYEVPVIYRGQCTFVVEADSPQEAKEKATVSFKGGVEPDTCGNEWEEIERVCEPQKMD